MSSIQRRIPADYAKLPWEAPPTERSARVMGVAAGLATASLATRGELATLLTQYATVLAHLETGDPAQPTTAAPARLSDAESAPRRLVVFLRSLHR